MIVYPGRFVALCRHPSLQLLGTLPCHRQRVVLAMTAFLGGRL